VNRRGFLAALGLSGATGAAAFASIPTDDSKGFVWETVCASCSEKVSQFIDMSEGAITAKNQCIHCLSTIYIADGLAQKVKEWNIKHGRKTTIYTPKKFTT